MADELEWWGMMTDEYIAGFFDGEGCVSTYRRRLSWSVRLIIGQRRIEVLKEIQRTLGCGTVHEVRLTINGAENVQEVIRRIYPYSIVKREELRLAYELAQLMNGKHSNRERRAELGQAIRDLKR